MKKIALFVAALALFTLAGCQKSKVDIKGVSDLAGKKIATPGDASIQHMLLKYYLGQNVNYFKHYRYSIALNVFIFFFFF